MFTIVVMDAEENFIQYLNPDLIHITETNEKYGIRTVSIEYYVEGIEDYKRLFRIGNKIWVAKDQSVRNCLYIINTPVENDLFDKNNVVFEAEEKLVELNFIFFSPTNLTDDTVTVDYNALKNWFGLYFNIGIVQNCLSDYLKKIHPTGTMSLMELLRYIEEETGNVFITQYEKDAQTNKIHSYINFLNPKSTTKQWELHLFYRFPRDSRDENTTPEVSEKVDIKEEEDNVYFPEYIVESPLNPNEIQIRLRHDNEILFQENAVQLGFTGEDDLYEFILTYNAGIFKIKINDNETNTTGWELNIPNGTVFEFYNASTMKTVYYYTLIPKLGDVHEEILDLGWNVENITCEVDESDTYVAIAPIINADGGDSLTNEELNTIIQNWEDLNVQKGDIIPMIVQKRTITGTDTDPCTSLNNAIARLGAFNLSSNYYSRPIKPNDSEDSTNKSYEFLVGTAYWRAPFSKIGKNNESPGELYVVDDDITGVEYTHIQGNQDNVDEATFISVPKCGSVETSDEDPYAIFNDVCMTLKDKRYPGLNIEVDVANLKNGNFNDYNIFDKVYVKIPGFKKVVATVLKTEKNPLDIGENKIELCNYSVNKKVAQKKTHIEASNIPSFMYPNSACLNARLINSEYDSDDSDSIEYIPDRLLTFTVYAYENESKTLTDKVYVKKTDSDGVASINLGLDPGRYIIDIEFGSDTEYASSLTSVSTTVGGVKEVTPKAKKTTTIKDTKKVKRYYSKYGVSPNKKKDKLCAIGRKSTGDKKKDAVYYITFFKRKCPQCGSSKLYWSIFWAGNEHKSYGTFPATGKKEHGADKGRIFCKNCGHGWNCLGESIGKGKNLKALKKSGTTKKAKAYELRDGSRQYDTVLKQYKLEKNLGNQGDTITRNQNNTGINYSGIPTKKVKDTAKNIVGNSTGLSAAKKIAKWVAKNIKIERREGFYQTPSSTLSRGRGNACCHADLFCQLCDAAGVTSIYDVYYIQVGTKYGKRHFFNKINGVDVDCYAKKKNPWRHASYNGRSISDTKRYPHLPLSRKY